MIRLNRQNTNTKVLKDRVDRKETHANEYAEKHTKQRERKFSASGIFSSKKVWPYVVIGTIITFLFYFSREIDFMENCNFAATKTTKFWVR